jgi:hypothetical protein
MKRPMNVYDWTCTECRKMGTAVAYPIDLQPVYYSHNYANKGHRWVRTTPCSAMKLTWTVRPVRRTA